MSLSGSSRRGCYAASLLIALLLTGASLAFAQPPAVTATPVSQISTPDTGCCGPVTAAGEHLLRILDGMDVEHLWQAHTKVHWRSGEPKSGHGATHCSAFAAAAGDRLGVYMLRPPQHSQEFLASAQGRWFEGEKGQHDGWRRVDSPLQAQQLANQGELVVLVYVNPDHHVPGHIAIVRPAIKSDAAIAKDGPQTMQAGLHNFANGNAVQSFSHHPGAWPTQVGIYAHTIDFSLPLPPPGKDDEDDDSDAPKKQ